MGIIIYNNNELKDDSSRSLLLLFNSRNYELKSLITVVMIIIMVMTGIISWSRCSPITSEMSQRKGCT